MSNKSKNKHLLDTIVEQGLPNSAIQLLATSNRRPVQLLQLLLPQLRLLQLQTIQIVRFPQIRNNELVGDLILFLIIGVHQHLAIKGAHSAGDENIAHGHACVDQSQTYAVHYCWFCASLVLNHGHYYLYLVFFVDVCYYHAFETFAHVLCELDEFPVLFRFSVLERAEGSDRVFNFEEEVGVRRSLVWAIDQAKHLSKPMPQQARAISMRVNSQFYTSIPQLLTLPAIRAVRTQGAKINIDHDQF